MRIPASDAEHVFKGGFAVQSGLDPLQGKKKELYMRKAFERVTPESVGLSSRDILDFVEALEASRTEMHGLMIMRHGKVASEGWWAPYGPGIRHGLQSHTKTYAATGVGIAFTEGLLRLDERVIDIFPEDAPENPSENLKLLTVRDVLCMGCGMDTMPRPTEHWIRDFLATPVVHKPGTAYMYNSTGSSLLCAIVEKKTGRKFHEYLTEKLFNKIGIIEENIRWYNMPDGTAMGGGGMFATTEDNLRLMKLYADGGVWEGERILSEEYVRLATTNQNDSATEAIGNPLATDNHLGYGFQIWMCRPEGVYRADGAMGQFTIVSPKLDLIIAINETAQSNEGGVHWAQNTLNLCWDYLEKVEQHLAGSPQCGSAANDALPEDAGMLTKLFRKMSCLSLPHPPFAPESSLIPEVNGRCWKLQEGNLDLRLFNFMNPSEPDRCCSFSLCFESSLAVLTLKYESGAQECVNIGLGGNYITNLMGDDSAVTRLLLCSGAWLSDREFTLFGRWVETCFGKELVFAFEDGRCVITEKGVRSPFGPEPKPGVYVPAE